MRKFIKETTKVIVAISILPFYAIGFIIAVIYYGAILGRDAFVEMW